MPCQIGDVKRINHFLTFNFIVCNMKSIFEVQWKVYIPEHLCVLK